MSRRLQIILIVLLAILSILVTTTIENDGDDIAINPSEQSSTEPPVFFVEYRRGVLSIAGHSSSDEHERQIDQLAADSFADVDRKTTYWPHVLLPDYWQPTTVRLVSALALTYSARADFETGNIEISGVVGDSRAWSDAMDNLRGALPADFILKVDIIFQNGAPEPADFCGRMFADVVRTPVEFRLSSIEIRTSSHAMLDRLVDFAHDCQGLAIAITGHSDASGHDAYNQSLSLARAQAVADYLTTAGVRAGRLSITGAGSSVPIADNATPHGRSLNRRIEFGISQIRP